MGLRSAATFEPPINHRYYHADGQNPGDGQVTGLMTGADDCVTKPFRRQS